MTRAFRINLAALSLLALLVGAFLIYNAMAFSVAQRWNLLGALRGLGASPGDIARLVCREALILSALGSALGVLAGALLGRGLVTLVARTLNDLYFATHVAGLRLDPLVLAKGGLLGLGLGLIASLGPAWQAARIRPRVLLTRSAQEVRLRNRLPRLNLGRRRRPGPAVGADGLAAGQEPAGRLRLPGPGDGRLGLVDPGHAAPALSAAGAAALGGLSRLSARGSAATLGRMAVRETGASLSRTGVAAAALMAALSVTVAMGIMVDSFRRAVRDWLEAVLVADVYAAAPHAGTGRREGRLDSAWLEAARRLPEVAGVTGYLAVVINSLRRIDAEADPARRTPRPGAAPRPGHGHAQPRGLPLPGGRSAPRPGRPSTGARLRRARLRVLRLPAPPASGHGPAAARRGRPARLPGGRRVRRLRDGRGAVMMDRACFDAHWRGRGHTSAAFFARAGLPADSLARALGRLPGSAAVEIRPTFRCAPPRWRSSTAPSPSPRCCGWPPSSSPPSAWWGPWPPWSWSGPPKPPCYVPWASPPCRPGSWLRRRPAFLGLCTGLLAVPLGLVQAGLLVHVINRRSFGWTLPLQVDPWICLQALLLGLGAALLAAALPAWKTSRTVTARALREE